MVIKQNSHCNCPAGSKAPPWLPSLHPSPGHFDLDIGAAERARLQRLAAKLRTEDRHLVPNAWFGDGVEAGLGPWPALFIEDHSEIALFETVGNVTYSYRILLLARDGDQVVIAGQRSPAFERYCRDDLKLGQAELLIPKRNAAARTLVARCLGDDALLDRAAEKARAAGGLNLFPYMGTGGAWALAAETARRAGTRVRIAAPSPGLTRRVNDKLWFAERVAEVLGAGALPHAVAAHGPAMLAARVAGLARSYPSVGIKIPDSASSAGNFVFSADALAGLSLRALSILLVERLRHGGWRGRFPVMVTAWESPVIASPSVQVWIPRPEQGLPLIEGLFEQSFLVTTLTSSGASAGAFAGAEPTQLSGHLQSQLAEGAGRLAYLFQQLGYFGRCSFDAILTQDDKASTRIHWIECNGRWGGVSLPMTLANRLFGDWTERPFVVIERNDLKLPPRDLAGVLQELEPTLYRAGEGNSGAILLSPSPFELGTGFEAMAVSSDLAGARRLAETLAARLSAMPSSVADS